MAEEVVSGMAPLVYASGKTIELVDHGSSAFQGYPSLIENAMRNLVDTAIRHTGSQAHIRVEVGPGPVFRVCDDGMRATAPQTQSANPSPRRIGLGLKIVGRIAEIHGGQLDINKRSGDGMVAKVTFPA